MFELFSNKKNHFIGIDFGTASLKVVELSYKDKKVHLENYGIVDLAAMMDSPSGRMKPYEERIIEALSSLTKKMEIERCSAFVSMPGFTGLVALLEFPDMSEEEIEKAIGFEAHKYIPTSLDEVAMSWEIVDKKTSSDLFAKQVGPKKIHVLLVAAPKREIGKYEKYITGAGLSVSAIELETFSISRALIGDEQGAFLIIDIGSRSTNIILVENGIVKVNRNIDAGGNEITSAIADSMNISKQRAEALKKGEKDIINSKEATIVVPVLELIVGESQRILGAYKEKNKAMKLEGVVLSGGTSSMVGIEQYFSKVLNTKTIIGNPWRRVTYNDKISPVINNLAASYSVAIGLALRGIEQFKKK